MYIVLDINSGSVHIVDELSYKLLDCFENGEFDENAAAALLSEYSKEEIDEKLHLKAFAWKEPFSFDKTPDEDKISEIFDFSDDGLKNILEKLQ